MATAYDEFLVKLLQGSFSLYNCICLLRRLSFSLTYAPIPTLPTAHTAKLGKAGEFRLVDTLFGFLRRHTSVMSSPEAIEQVNAIAQRHAEVALTDAAKAAEATKTTDAVAPAAAPAATAGKTSEAAKSAPATAPAAAEEETEDEAVEDDESAGAVPSSLNGGVGPGYTWTQSLLEATLSIPVAASVRAKDCQVDFTGSSGAGDDGSLRVRVCGEELLSGALSAGIVEDEFGWTLEAASATAGVGAGSKVLNVFFPKRKQLNWWPSVIRGHPEVNVAKIAPENARLGDLDPHTRKMVEGMMFEQRKKAMDAAKLKAQAKQAAGAGARAASGLHAAAIAASVPGAHAPGADAAAVEREAARRQEAFAEFQKMHPEMDFSQARFM
jgi:hypothetical protein